MREQAAVAVSSVLLHGILVYPEGASSVLLHSILVYPEGVSSVLLHSILVYLEGTFLLCELRSLQ